MRLSRAENVLSSAAGGMVLWNMLREGERKIPRKGTIMELRGINHLAFIAKDMNETIRFYRDLLGMKLWAGVGHDGFRHYFLQAGNTQVAFFGYEEAQAMPYKFHGSPTNEQRGYDHVAFTVDTVDELFAWKDKLEAAGLEVTGAIDHGTLWSIYFFDPNNIPLEITWDCVEIDQPPVVADDAPLEVVAEGSEPRPGLYPEPEKKTPRSEFRAKDGNGYAMRQALLQSGRGQLKPELVELLEQAEKEKAQAKAGE